MNNLDNQQAQDNQQSEPNAANTLAGTEQPANNDVQAQQIANANPLPQGGTDQQQQQQSAAVNPVTYDFSKVELPEDYQLSEEESNMFKDVIKDMGLSNEQAGAIVKFGAEYGKRLVDGVVKEYEDTVNGWGETAKQELGADFDKTVKLAVFARDKFPGLQQALEDSGAGNRVEIIRALAKLGEYMSSDPGMAQGAGVQKGSGIDPMNDAKALYPNTDFSKYL